MIDTKANILVWATSCTSWFIDETTRRNTIMYPDSIQVLVPRRVCAMGGYGL